MDRFASGSVPKKVHVTGPFVDRLCWTGPAKIGSTEPVRFGTLTVWTAKNGPVHGPWTGPNERKRILPNVLKGECGTSIFICKGRHFIVRPHPHPYALYPTRPQNLKLHGGLSDIVLKVF